MDPKTSFSVLHHPNHTPQGYLYVHPTIRSLESTLITHRIPYISGDILDIAVCQNLVPLVNIKIAGKWMFIPLKMVLIGIDPYPYNSGDILYITLYNYSRGITASCCFPAERPYGPDLFDGCGVLQRGEGLFGEIIKPMAQHIGT